MQRTRLPGAFRTMSTGFFSGLASRLPAPGSTGGRILRGTVVVGVVAGLVKAVSLGKELAVAAAFGRADALDAFLIALLVPATLGGVAGGAFHQAVLPLYARERERRGPEAADAFFRACFGAALLATAAVAALAALAAGPLLAVMASGFDAPKLALARSMAWALAPVAVMAAAASMLAAVFHSGERFAAGAGAPITTPLATLVLLACLGAGAGWPLVGGSLAGGALEVAILALLAAVWGRSLVPTLPRAGDPLFREAAAQWWPAIGAMSIHTATGIVDQVMAGHLAAGSVSALGYAYRLVGAPLGLVTLALGTASFAVFSRLRTESGEEALRRSLRRLAVRVALISVVVAGALAVAAPVIVRVVYQRGRFVAADAALVASLVRLYSLMLPAYVLGILGVKGLAALGRNRRIVPIAAVNLVVSVVSNIVLVNFLGIRGIALSNVVVYTVSCAQIWYAMRGEPHREP